MSGAKAATHSRFVLIGAFMAAVVGVAGCGVRGSLELPPEAKAQQNTATSESGQGKPAGEAAKPHKPFVLDGLLR